MSKWLRDVLVEARDRELPAARQLPHDLARDRFHSWPLPLLGAPPPGGGRSNEPAQAFREAIGTPLELTVDSGEPRYPWSFAGDGAERLARAFAAARRAQPDAPLVPELQVVLAHLLKQAGEAEGSEPAVVEVPENLEAVIDQALEGHLHRALDAAFLGQSVDAAREGRTLVLLTLSELADAEGKRGESRPAGELAKAICDRGHEILEMLAQSDTRLLVSVDRTDGRHYALSHDRLAEVIVRAVEEEGVHGDLDRDLLGLRRFVRLNTELLRSNEEQATSIPRGDFRQIADRAGALLWSEAEGRWWEACQKRRRADLRRLTAWSAVAATTVVLIGLWIGSRLGKLEEQTEIVGYFASGQVERMLGVVEEERLLEGGQVGRRSPAGGGQALSLGRGSGADLGPLDPACQPRGSGTRCGRRGEGSCPCPQHRLAPHAGTARFRHCAEATGGGKLDRPPYWEARNYAKCFFSCRQTLPPSS